MKDKLNRMRVYLDLAKKEWTLRHIDDAHVDITCHLLMFSLEIGLKYLITVDGVTPPTKHRLKPLLIALPEKYYKSNWYMLLEKWKDQTNDWYNESRYSDDFSAINNAVVDYLVAAEELLNDADKCISYTCDVETKVKRILNKLNSTKSVSEVIKYLPDTELPESILFDLVVEILYSK